MVFLSWNNKKNKIIDINDDNEDVVTWTLKLWELVNHNPTYLTGRVLDVTELEGKIGV